MDKPKPGTRLRLKVDKQRHGEFIRAVLQNGKVYWLVKQDWNTFWYYAPDEWELEPTVRVKP